MVDGVSGYICDTKQDYIAALTRLHGDAELREHMGAAACHSIETTFELTAICAQWDALYERVIGSRARSS